MTKLKTFLLVLMCTSTMYAQEIDNLAKSLIQLRDEVKALHSELDDAKETYRIRMQSLAQQRADLESSIARQELKSKQTLSQLEKIKKRIIEKSHGTKELKPVAIEALAKLKASLNGALPFKLKERNDQIDDLTQKISNNLIVPQKAINRVWSIYEDNFRMSHENGMFRQTVTIDDKEYLADVVRIGSVMMFFKTSDERVGYFGKKDGSYSPIEVQNSAHKELVVNLFDAMKKQIRSGFFIVPNTFGQGAL